MSDPRTELPWNAVSTVVVADGVAPTLPGRRVIAWRSVGTESGARALALSRHVVLVPPNDGPFGGSAAVGVFLRAYVVEGGTVALLLPVWTSGKNPAPQRRRARQVMTELLAAVTGFAVEDVPNQEAWEILVTGARAVWMPAWRVLPSGEIDVRPEYHPSLVVKTDVPVIGAGVACWSADEPVRALGMPTLFWRIGKGRVEIVPVRRHEIEDAVRRADVVSIARRDPAIDSDSKGDPKPYRTWPAHASRAESPAGNKIQRPAYVVVRRGHKNAAFCENCEEVLQAVASMRTAGLVVDLADAVSQRRGRVLHIREGSGLRPVEGVRESAARLLASLVLVGDGDFTRDELASTVWETVARLRHSAAQPDVTPEGTRSRLNNISQLKGVLNKAVGEVIEPCGSNGKARYRLSPDRDVAVVLSEVVAAVLGVK